MKSHSRRSFIYKLLVLPSAVTATKSLAAETRSTQTAARISVNPRAQINSTLADALNNMKGGDLQIPAGQHHITIDDGLFNIEGDIVIRSDSGAPAELHITHASSRPFSIISCKSSRLVLQNITIFIQSSAQHSVVISINGQCADFRMIDCAVVGENDNSPQVRPHGIHITDSAQVGRALVSNTTFKLLNYGIFTSNLFFGGCRNWVIEKCRFISNHADDLEFNSALNPQMPWQGINISNCEFSRPETDIKSKFSGMAIGVDSGSQFIISSCRFTGYKREAIHIENNTHDIIVSKNIFIKCARGISVFQQNSFGVMIEGNIFDYAEVLVRRPTTIHPNDANIAIDIANPGVISSSSYAKISNNLIKGYDIGIYCPVDRGGVVSNNTISLCHVALFLPSQAMARTEGSRIIQCQYAYSSPPGDLGSCYLEDTEELVSSNGVYSVEIGGVLTPSPHRDNENEARRGHFNFWGASLINGKIIVSCSPHLVASCNVNIKNASGPALISLDCGPERNDFVLRTNADSNLNGISEILVQLAALPSPKSLFINSSGSLIVERRH
ncbi:right-handed parallel beta-helix repeat-containing protein [Aquabacterium sp.]|uniref:right-handed parallel beta-helix repeat-containing protein n=1 Tax=Aquabacterium sp. TaxID=1872578 RepID=UPI0035B1F5FF